MMDVVLLALSKNYTDKEITKAATSLKFKQKIVDSLPDNGEEHTIYFVKNNSSWRDNYYDAYLWISSTNSFEKIGSTEIDSNFLLPSYSEDDAGKSLIISSENKQPNWIKQTYIDYSNAQELTDEQKAQARDNIGVPKIATDEDVLDFLTGMEMVVPVTSSSGEIFISSSNEIYFL